MRAGLRVGLAVLPLLGVAMLVPEFIFAEPPVQATPRPPFGLILPPVHSGDQVTYEELVLAKGDAEPKTKAVHAFAIDVTDAAFPDGTLRPSARLQTHDGRIRTAWYLDLADRRLFRVDDVMVSTGTELTEQTRFAELEWPTFHLGRWLALNGPVIREGTGLPANDVRAILSTVFPKYFGDARRPDTEVSPHFNWTVERYGVDGSATLEIRYRSALWFKERRTDGPFYQPEWQVTLSQTAPFPLRFAYHQVLPGEDGDVVVASREFILRSWTAGKDPVPWGDPPQDTVADWERGPLGTRHPVDGGRSSIKFPLRDALDRADAAMDAPRFRQWRQANPSAQLVGATLRPDAHREPVQSGTVPETPILRWTLAFAATSGEAFVVEAARSRQTGVVTVRDLGPADRRVAFDPSQMPSQVPTLSALEERWRWVAPERFRGLEVNHVHWGWDASEDWEVPSYSNVYPNNWSRAEIGYRHMESFGMIIHQGRPITHHRHDESRLTLDVVQGQLRGAFHTGYRGDLGGVESPVGGANKPNKGAPESLPTRAANGPQATRGAITVDEVALGTVVAAATAFSLFHVVKLLVGPLIAGYAKLRRSQVLSHPAREALMEALRTNPGSSPLEMEHGLDMPLSTIVYHLRVLEQHRFVRCITSGRSQRYFVVEGGTPAQQSAEAVLLEPRKRAVFDAICEEPGISQKEIAARLGIKPPSAIDHLRDLERAGLVERSKEKGRVRYVSRRVPTGA